MTRATVGRKRLTFQLTPLLDLLLIVIFAQYMEVQSASRAESDRTAEAEQRVATAEERATNVERDADRRVADLEDQLAEARAEHERLAERFAEIFETNETIAAAALDPNSPKLAGLSDEQREALKKRFREIVRNRGGRALEHLVTYEELRKRADVWHVRVGTVAEGGRITLRTGDRSETLRADSVDDLTDRIYGVYKDLPQPKDHVIMLLVYDSRRSELVSLNIVRRALPRVANRMQADGDSKFFWAEIGYDPKVLGLQN